jgi:hypothetical protein
MRPVAVAVKLAQPDGDVRVGDVVVLHGDAHGDQRGFELVHLDLPVPVSVELVEQTVQRGGVDVAVHDDAAHRDADVVRDPRAVALRLPQPRRGHLAFLELGVHHLERAVRGEPGERHRRADEVGEPVRAAARQRRRLRRDKRQARENHDARVERRVVVHGDARVREAVREPVRALLLDRLAGEAVQVAAADPQAASPRDGEQHHRAARERAHPDAHLLLRLLLGRAQPGGDDDGRVGDSAQDGEQQSAHQPGGEHLQQELAPVGD